MGREAIKGKASRRTTEGVVAEVEKAKPALALLAKAAGSKLRINVFKEERTVEISSPGWINPVVYKMTAFSGKLGPKLKEGDRQIPEGIYCVEYMNPNSSYHLSFKVSYPNDFDKAMAASRAREAARKARGSHQSWRRHHDSRLERNYRLRTDRRQGDRGCFLSRCQGRLQECRNRHSAIRYAKGSSPRARGIFARLVSAPLRRYLRGAQ